MMLKTPTAVRIPGRDSITGIAEIGTEKFGAEGGHGGIPLLDIGVNYRAGVVEEQLC